MRMAGRSGPSDSVRNPILRRSVVWGVLDQAVYATSSLLVTLLVARSVVPSEFGRFSAGYLVLLKIGRAHV